MFNLKRAYLFCLLMAVTGIVLTMLVGGNHASLVIAGNGGVRFAYATSADGINWTVDDYPVLAAGPELYDLDGAAHGTVLKEGETYKLWYHALGDQGAIIAYATSPDGLDQTGRCSHPHR